MRVSCAPFLNPKKKLYNISNWPCRLKKLKNDKNKSSYPLEEMTKT